MNDTHRKLSSSMSQHESVNLLTSKPTVCTSKTKTILLVVTCFVVIGVIVIILVATGVFESDTSTGLLCNDRCTANYTAYIQSMANSSLYWTDEQKADYLLNFRSTALGECIINMNITEHAEIRPDPSCYLPPDVIEYHLGKFMEYGASSISNTRFAYLSNFSSIGYPPNSFDTNGVQWISPYPIQTQLLQNCAANGPEDAGDCVLTALGIPSGEWSMFEYNWLNVSYIPSDVEVNRVMQVHIFAYNMKALNLRIPSGNEMGTDHSLWRPGGYTINGTEEAVIDLIKVQQYCWKPVTEVDGTWCYPNCDVICENAEGCTQASC